MDDQESADGFSQALQIKQLLAGTGHQLVLAESCTAGQAAAWIGAQPGISAHFCGSAVVYQEETKQQWLDVSGETLADQGAVSPQVADQMAIHALKTTSQATLAAAITGHLGPGAPAELDGVLELAIAVRTCPTGAIVSAGSTVTLPPADRQARQKQAARRLLALMERALLAWQAHEELGETTHGRILLPALGREVHADSDQLVFPGAFSPWHQGHAEMISTAEKSLGLEAALELSFVNVDKPTLSAVELVERVIPLGNYPVWLTHAATFEEKAACFPGAKFIVGADTVARIGEPGYYDDDEDRMRRAIAGLASAGVELLVFGRKMNEDFQTSRDSADARFVSLDQLDLPGPLRQLCRPVGEEEFRCDISSRDLGPDEG